MPHLAHSTSAAEQSQGEQMDLLHLLLEGHEHIRSFTALAVQLGHTRDASASALSSAASRVLHYFTRGLPVHLENEDRSLVPLLFTTPLPQELIQILWVMGRQHEELEQLVDQLVPSWTALRDTPERYPELMGPLAKGARRLLALTEDHLELEEQLIFPLARSRFSRARLVELAREILQERRQPS